MTAQQPNTPNLATVESAAVRQTGESEQTPASLDQPKDSNPSACATPEHGEVQSCAPQPQPFRHVEILVDGKRMHSILATSVQTHEDSERLTLEARRWIPFLGVAEPDPDVLKRAHAAMTGVVELAEALANTGRGSCPECQSGAHTCAKAACYCEDPHRCGWPYPYVQEGNSL